jgi:hypothetical protein
MLRALAVVLLLGSVVVARAAELKPAERARVVAEVLELAAVRASVEQLQRALAGPLSQQPLMPEATARDIIVPAFRQAFSVEQLYAYVQSAFERNFDAGRLAAVAKQLRTPLGRRMTALEAEAQSPSNADALRDFVHALSTNPPSAERLALIRRLDNTTRATEVNLELNVAAQVAVTRVVDVVLPPAQRRNPPDVADAMRALPLATWSGARTGTENGLLFAYRNASAKELRAYAEMTESEAGRWFAAVLHRAFLESFAAATAQAVEAVRTGLAARRSPEGGTR